MPDIAQNINFELEYFKHLNTHNGINLKNGKHDCKIEVYEHDRDITKDQNEMFKSIKKIVDNLPYDVK